ncbi:polyprenol reductase isoform X1 [Octopus bimaculoides]|uniref:polyprenol reductase isoform X1 n=2 Tax=Octopus bimaculoides TaxID=37653 RepID=UPI0022E26A58|nr:polyprenol reductase isoform X1 [Octopus bimaculoides]XP_052828362.1 polyprenol reductase isoform X1 [Octopus bimaculoides]XP_052828363.1 polyprenol reductase isoform X1 [Octopus bimaculoides]
MCNSGIMLCIVLSSSFIQPFTSPTTLLGCSSWSGPIDNFTTVLVLSCITVHTCRRYIESRSVSIYSSATISILHYITGFIHYFSLSAIPTVESVVICNNTKLTFKELHLSKLHLLHLLGFLLFVVSSWKQNHYCIMLSNLRKKKANQIKNTDYYIPDGDLFKFISCPHFLMEILIHVSFSMMSYFSNIPLLSLLLFVITNQLISGFLNHRWYKNMVPSYPQERRAVIPFLF